MQITAAGANGVAAALGIVLFFLVSFLVWLYRTDTHVRKDIQEFKNWIIGRRYIATEVPLEKLDEEVDDDEDPSMRDAQVHPL